MTDVKRYPAMIQNDRGLWDKWQVVLAADHDRIVAELRHDIKLLLKYEEAAILDETKYLTEIDTLRAEVDRLKARLEITDGQPYDGIDCRDATIAGLQGLVDQYRESRQKIQAERYGLRFNSPGTLPPVDCPLLIRTPQGLLQATRPSFIGNRGDSMVYRLDDGSEIEGRFPWTYP